MSQETKIANLKKMIESLDLKIKKLEAQKELYELSLRSYEDKETKDA